MNLTYKLSNGEVVLAKLSRGNLYPFTYSNRTQAEKKAEAVGGEVVQRGRPFFVRMPA